jgi:predicted nucleic acid-binding protein
MEQNEQPVILDASIALAWIFQDEESDYADRVQQTVKEQGAFASTLFPLEVCNGLLVGERDKRCTEAESTRWLTLLYAFPLTSDAYGITDIFSQEVLCLARKYALTAYDATYLELAQRLHFPLATLDIKLKKAAKQAEVSVFQ